MRACFCANRHVIPMGVQVREPPGLGIVRAMQHLAQPVAASLCGVQNEINAATVELLCPRVAACMLGHFCFLSADRVPRLHQAKVVYAQRGRCLEW